MYFCYIYLFVAQIVPDEKSANEWVAENPGERWYEFKPIPLRSVKNEENSFHLKFFGILSELNSLIIEKKKYEGVCNEK